VARKDQELRPVMTRIPERLRRQLEREAEKNRRSMNAEIIHRLEQSFQAKYWAKVVGPIVEHAVSTGLQNATPLWGDTAAPRSGEGGDPFDLLKRPHAPRSADPNKKAEGEGQ
jgi:Arc-like DNA binding domain